MILNSPNIIILTLVIAEIILILRYYFIEYLTRQSAMEEAWKNCLSKATPLCKNCFEKQRAQKEVMNNGK